jgi:putative inorganic carbon (hco3(-)) transporter
VTSPEVAATARAVGPPPAAWRYWVVAAALGIGAIVAAAPLLGLAAVSAAFLGVVIATRPDWATIAAAALLYSNAAVVLHRVHGLPKVVGQSAGLLVAIALVHHLGVRRRPLLLPAATPWVVLFLVVQVVGAVGAREPVTALESVQDFLTGGLFVFLAFTNAVRTEDVLHRVVWVVLAVGAVLGTVTLHQSVTGDFRDDYLGFAQISEEGAEARAADAVAEDGDSPRQAGPIGEKNYYAQVMFVLVPLGLMLFVGHPRRSRRLLSLALTGAIAVGGGLALSRGGAVGLALALLVLAALRYLPVRHLVIAAVGIGLLLVSSPRYLDRLSTVAGSVTSVVAETPASTEVDGAVLGRLGANAAALRVFADHPVLGVGSGMFNEHYREEAIEAGFRVHEGTRSAHNLYLHILAEFGLVGAVAFFGAIGVTLRDMARARRRLGDDRAALRAVLAGLVGAVIAYLTTGLFLSYAYERYAWFLLALGAAAAAVAAGGEDPSVAPETTDRRRSVHT